MTKFAPEWVLTSDPVIRSPARYRELGLQNQPSTVWNMDETHLNFTHTPVRVVSGKSERSTPGKTGNSREGVKVIACGFDFIECFTTTFLRTHSWLNWVDEDDDEVGLKEKPEDTRYIKKITSK